MSDEVTLSRFIVLPLGILVVLLLTCAAYWQGLSGPFILDDFHNIHTAQLESWSWDYFKYLTFNNESGIIGRPVSTASLVLTSLFYGLDPWWYKYENLQIHLLNGLLLLWLGWKILSVTLPQRKALQISFLAFVFWVLHPLFVSTVLYPVQRMAELSALWSIASVLCYVYLRTSNSIVHKFAFLVAQVFFMLLAILSKENGALIPLLLLACEFCVLYKNVSPMKFDKAAIVMLIIAPIIIGIIGFAVLSDRILNYEGRDYTLLERLMTQTELLWFYMAQIAFPQPNEMGLYLDDWPVVRSFNVSVALSTLAILTILSWILLSRKLEYLRFGLLWFFFGHAMESTILPLEIIFEHRNYFPGWGLLIGLSYTLFTCPNKLRLIALPIASLVFVLNVFHLFERSNTWKTKESLLAVSHTLHPDSYRVNVEMAGMYVIRGNLDKGRYYLNRASKVQPGNAGVPIVMIVTYCEESTIPENLYDNAIAVARNNPLGIYGLKALNTLNLAIIRKQCPAASKEKLLELAETVIENNPPEGFTYRVAAQSYVASNSYDQAQKYYRLAFDLKPDISLLQETIETDINNNRHEMALELIKKAEIDSLFSGEYQQKVIANLKEAVIQLEGQSRE